MKICVLIPAYNESATIGRIVGGLKSKGLDVFVIDDGSSDNTAEIAERQGAFILGRFKNIGKGASLIKGFKYILKNTGFDAVIIMDGDGQHSINDIDKFIERADKGKALVVGNRMASPGSMPRARFITNKYMSILISLICKQKVPDTQCGFRLVKRQVLELIKLTSWNYEIESEMLIEAARKGFSLDSVPIETIYREEVSLIHPIWDAMRFLSLLVRMHFRKGKKR